MQEERWYPSNDSNQVIGRFEWYDQLMIAESLAADVKKYRKIIVLRHKVIGTLPDSEDVTMVKEFNSQILKDRFPQAWAAFNNEEVPAEVGTLLSDPAVRIEGLTPQRVELFRMSGVMTLEQLVGMSDAQCQGAGFGVRTMREHGKKLLETIKADADAKARAFVQKQMAEAEAKKLTLSEHDIAKGLNEALKRDSAKKRGRPFGSKNKPKAATTSAHAGDGR